MNINTLLFGKRQEIKSIKSVEKKTNTKGPAGRGLSKFRTATDNSAKYSAVALLVDEILVNKSVNALESVDSVYTEFSVNGTNYKAICDGVCIDWEDEAPSGDYAYCAMMPLFMFALKAGKTRSDVSVEAQKELKDAFSRMAKNYAAYKTVETDDMLLACDNFYYVYVKDHADIPSNANSVAKEAIELGYSSGIFSEMDALKDVDTLPSFNIQIKGKRTKKAEKKSIEKDYQKCKDGECRISYGWSEEQSQMIPSLSTLENYVPDKKFFSILSKVTNRLGKTLMRMDAGKEGVEAIGNDYINLMITGKPGTGKTVTAYALGAATGMPTYTVALSKNSEEDTFEGMNKVVDGSLSFVTTGFLDAYTNGGIIILEEVNLADPAVVMGGIGQAIEFPFILKKNGYETIRRHPMCVIIATMNVGTYGSKGVNQAFSSRFKQSYVLDDPTKDQFIKILEIQGYEKRKCEYVYTAYDRIVNHLKSPKINAEEICLSLTIRGCLGALQNMDDGDKPSEAILNSLVGKIYEVDPEIADSITKEVINTLPNL